MADRQWYGVRRATKTGKKPPNDAKGFQSTFANDPLDEAGFHEQFELHVKSKYRLAL